MKKLIAKLLLKLHKLFPKHIPVMTCYGCLNDYCINRTKGKNKTCDGYIKGKYKNATNVSFYITSLFKRGE